MIPRGRSMINGIMGKIIQKKPTETSIRQEEKGVIHLVIKVLLPRWCLRDQDISIIEEEPRTRN